jgi:hypothetical protein
MCGDTYARTHGLTHVVGSRDFFAARAAGMPHAQRSRSRTMARPRVPLWSRCSHYYHRHSGPRTGTDLTFANKLHAQLGSHTHLARPRFVPDGFVIRHYAQAVAYTAAGFLEKNRDTITGALPAHMRHHECEAKAWHTRTGGGAPQTSRWKCCWRRRHRCM